MAGLDVAKRSLARPHPSGIGSLVDCEECGRTYVVIGPRYNCSKSGKAYGTPFV